MPAINKGRHTARIEGDFVVFLIGARINWRNPIQSLRDLGGFKFGMPGMLKYLTEHPEKGLLAYEQPGGTTVIQYCRSFAHLEAFSKDKNDPHYQSWRNYWKRVGKSDRTGIWHETFLVRAGEYEAIYGNMPTHGLAKAGELEPLHASSSARERLSGKV
ncbi:MAG: DUF4188 domain-containing protein [Nocardiaceae bacterium]|nr:DUF4188 domain-containing protein [Nocardiaceae bacterium]